MNKTLLATSLALALVSAGQVMGQNLYAGGGLAYTNGTSDTVSAGSGSSSLTVPLLSAIFGQRFASANAFWGWETNADFGFGVGTKGSITDAGCAGSASGSYLCEQDATARFVGYLGTTVGNGIGVFGSVGVGGLHGQFSTSPSVSDSGYIFGWTAGVGISHGLFNGMEMRGELIYDKFGNPDQPKGFKSEYTGTTLRVSVVRKF